MAASHREPTTSGYSLVASRRLVALLTTIVLVAAACSSTGASPVTASASPSHVVKASASASPIAVQDGEPWIVYQWTGIGLVRADGSHAHEIATDLTIASGLAGVAGHPDWSPDGKLIAFELQAGDGAAEIWTANADGTDPRKLLGCEAAPCLQVWVPAWSPDGKRLAFQRSVNATGRYQDDQLTIEVLDLVTGKARVVAAAPRAGSEYVEYVDPRWSSDGTEIAFVVDRFPTPPSENNLASSSIAVVKADGSEADPPRILTDPAMFGTYPDWSPDGERIVFNTYPLNYLPASTKASNLYTIRPDGSGLTQLTHFGDDDTRAVQPTWTPDGTRIIFTHILRNSSGGLLGRHPAFIDADGSNLTVLLAVDATHPRLRPTP